MLEDHADRIAAATAKVPAPRLRDEAMLGVWTAADVLAHLRCCADTFADVVPRILATERPRLEVVGPRDRMESSGYRELVFSSALRAFMHQRKRVLTILRALPPSGPSRSAIIVDRGRTRVRIVGEYTDWLARHEERHVEHFELFGRRTARGA